MTTAEATKAPPKIGTVCWSELCTRDAKKGREFYTKLFGWTTEDMPMGPGNTYTMFQNAGESFGGIMETNTEETKDVPPMWLNYIAVKDVDAVAKKAASLGAHICKEPTDIPGIGRFAVITDPTGAAFALYKSANA